MIVVIWAYLSFSGYLYNLKVLKIIAKYCDKQFLIAMRMCCKWLKKELFYNYYNQLQLLNLTLPTIIT